MHSESCSCSECMEERELNMRMQEEGNQHCRCCNCGEELEDWEKQIIDIIEDFADRIENEDLCKCGCTLRNMLLDMFYQARQIGFEDGMECGIESVEEKTVNFHIDSLTVNSNNVKDLVEQLKRCVGNTRYNSYF